MKTVQLQHAAPLTFLRTTLIGDENDARIQPTKPNTGTQVPQLRFPGCGLFLLQYQPPQPAVPWLIATTHGTRLNCQLTLGKESMVFRTSTKIPGIYVILAGKFLRSKNKKTLLDHFASIGFFFYNFRLLEQISGSEMMPLEPLAPWFRHPENRAQA